MEYTCNVTSYIENTNGTARAEVEIKDDQGETICTMHCNDKIADIDARIQDDLKKVCDGIRNETAPGQATPPKTTYIVDETGVVSSS